MSENTDVLGKALSYTLEGLRKEELDAAILGLHKSVGTSSLACVIHTGLLTIRTKLTLEEWDDAIKSMKKGIASVPPVVPPPKLSSVPQFSNSIPLHSNSSLNSAMSTPMDVDEPLEKTPKKKECAKIAFQPLSEMVTPKDLISKFFTYLDAGSHAALETCNKLLLIISRNPSSTLVLGRTFEGFFCFMKMYSSPSCCPSMQWVLNLNPKQCLEGIMTAAHRFRHLRKLSVFGDEAALHEAHVNLGESAAVCKLMAQSEIKREEHIRPDFF